MSLPTTVCILSVICHAYYSVRRSSNCLRQRAFHKELQRFMRSIYRAYARGYRRKKRGFVPFTISVFKTLPKAAE